MTTIHRASPLLSAVLSDLKVRLPEDCEVPAEKLPERTVARVELEVARRLFGRKFPGWRELKAYLDKNRWDDPENRSMRLSEQTIALFGIGDDRFFLNEHFHRDTKLSDFSNLLEWDRFNHEVQEEYRVEEGHIAAARPYSGRLLWEWSRWIDPDGGLVYGNLSCARSDVVHQAGEHFDRICRERYPTEFVDGPENGKEVGGGFIKWDMVEMPRDAAALRWACSIIMTEFLNGDVDRKVAALLEESGVWLARTRTEEKGERNEALVFSGMDAMAAARFRTWRSDIAGLPEGGGRLARITAAAVSMVDEFAPAVFAAVESAASGWKGGDLPHSSVIAEKAALLMGQAAAELDS